METRFAVVLAAVLALAFAAILAGSIAVVIPANAGIQRVLSGASRRIL
ncbi:MAG: hypothetical protein LBI87_12565 [Candidatus Accumulibacter sp.]|nr:hypothetical protein [Accumulibacter sp.]